MSPVSHSISFSVWLRCRRIALAVTVALTAAFIVAMPQGARADTWPNKPVRMVVAYPPGQSTDIASRYFANKLSAALGQQVFVENKPGAFGNIGTAFAARQAPDGYTILMSASGPHAVNPALYENIGYDPDKDFEPIIATAVIPMMISASPTLGVNTLPELIALAKSKPDKIDVALASVSAKIVFEMLKQRGAPLFPVNFKGSGEAMSALLGNQVPVLIDTAAATRPQLSKIKPLAVTSPTAMSALPEIKSAAEQGLTGFSVTAWNALVVPRGTPPEVKERLTVEMRKILALPETAKTLSDLGFEPAPDMKTEELAAWMRAERQKYGDIIKAAGIKP